MDPVTHMLTGACVSRAGLNRKTALATLTLTLAFEAPDIDSVSYFWGSIAGLQHHRGITHSLIGAPFMAAAVVALVYGIHRWRSSRQKVQRGSCRAANVSQAAAELEVAVCICAAGRAGASVPGLHQQLRRAPVRAVQ